jgi:hypothetical protein
LGWKVSSGAMLKMDVQFIKSKDAKNTQTLLNTGVAVWF